MLKVENGRCEVKGEGKDLILDLAVAINSLRHAFEDKGEEAIEFALALSEDPVMDLFTVEDLS